MKEAGGEEGGEEGVKSGGRREREEGDYKTAREGRI